MLARWYLDLALCSATLETLPGFLLLPSHYAVDVDVFVVDTLADLGRIENALLSLALAPSVE